MDVAKSVHDFITPTGGRKPPPDIKVEYSFTEPDEDGVAHQINQTYVDGELFPYHTDGPKLVSDFVPGRPHLGKVVYIPVVANSYEETFDRPR